jgi:isoprenylcysteine carboxyl methyltransferase (ICMT) family protein YpbQ
MQHHQKTFALLALAFGISAAYQYYRSTLGEHPADSFATTEIIVYSLLLLFSCLALLRRRWAAKAIVVLCALQLGCGIFYYIPMVFASRHERFWDWAELIVFVLLIAWAGYRSVVQLAGKRHELRYS